MFFSDRIIDSVTPTHGAQIWKTIKLPLRPSPPKLELQQLLHAVEELYFLSRFDEAVRFVRDVLISDAQAPFLDEDTRKPLETYERKCLQKAEKTNQ